MSHYFLIFYSRARKICRDATVSREKAEPAFCVCITISDSLHQYIKLQLQCYRDLLRLSSMAFKNFKSYKSTQALHQIKDLTILTGPNNSGKSNIINVARLYSDLVKNRLNRSYLIELSPLFFESSEPIQIELEFVLGEPERKAILDSLDIEPQLINVLETSTFLYRIRHSVEIHAIGVTSESLSISNTTGGWLEIYKGSGQGSFSINFEKTIRNVEFDSLEKINVNDRIRGAFSFYFLNGSRTQDRLGFLITKYTQNWLFLDPIRIIKTNIQSRDENRLFPSGENVLRVIHTLVQDYDLMENFREEISNLIPEIQRVITRNPEGKLTALINEEGGKIINIENSSSGTKQLVTILIGLFSYPKNSLFLIEEPEIHLHARAQRSIFHLLKKICTERESQSIITTHSTIFSEISDNANTYLIRRNAIGSTITLLENNYELKTIKQALGYENTDLFGYNGLLIIEGNSEERVIPLLLTEFNIDFVKHGIKMYNAGGSGKITRIEKLVEYLKDSDVWTFFILDNHEENTKKMDDLVRRSLINKECLYYLEKGFEDNFDNKLLSLALTSVARDKSIDIEFTDEEIQKGRTEGQSLGHFLKNIFYTKTGGELSKPDLAEAIVKNADKEVLWDTKIVKYLKKIQEKMTVG